MRLLFLFLFSSSFAIAQNPFQVGVCVHLGPNKEPATPVIELLASHGATSIRTDVKWDAVEKVKGQYSMPAAWDEVVNASVRNHIEPLLSLDYANPLYDGNAKPSSPEAVEAYSRFAEFVARHFKGKVHFYEVWNEWDWKTGHFPPGEPEPYVRLLKATYPKLKAVDPSIVVMGGALTIMGMQNGFLDSMLSGGAEQYMDGLSIHPYGTRDAPSIREHQINDAETMLRKYNHGADFPIYLSEFSFNTSTSSTGVDPDTSAAYLMQIFFLVRTMPYVKGIWWYDYKDDGTDPTYNEHNYGLFKADMTPKPSVDAFTEVATLFKRVTSARQISMKQPGVRGVQFEISGGKPEIALWKEGKGSAQFTFQNSAASQGHIDVMHEQVFNAKSSRTLTPNASLPLNLAALPVVISGDVAGLAK